MVGRKRGRGDGEISLDSNSYLLCRDRLTLSIRREGLWWEGNGGGEMRRRGRSL